MQMLLFAFWPENTQGLKEQPYDHQVRRQQQHEWQTEEENSFQFLQQFSVLFPIW